MSTIDVSVNYTQGSLLEEVSIAVLAMSLRDVQGNAQRMQALIDSANKVAPVIVDPYLAGHVDLTRREAPGTKQQGACAYPSSCASVARLRGLSGLLPSSL